VYPGHHLEAVEESRHGEGPRLDPALDLPVPLPEHIGDESVGEVSKVYAHGLLLVA
jgi:hypothetical protein